MKEWEMRKALLEMSDESFSRLCEHLTEDQKRVLLEMRFFHKLFQDPDFYKTVEQAVGEALYDELTINRGARASL